MSRNPHRRVFIIGGIAAVIMLAFPFAIVPFYSIICKATGLNTSVPAAELISPALAGQKPVVDMTREVKVQFVAMNHMGMPWDFYPQTKAILIHPGQNNKVYFHIKNTINKQMTVQAVPSMTPTEAISHFHKIECFCFTQQTLKGEEAREMPLVFNVDASLPKEVHVITLVYTLFDMTPKVTPNAIKKG